MKLLDALKRATSLERKGGFVALLPPRAGLPSRAAVKSKGLWVSWILDEPIDPPGAVFEVGALQQALKYGPHTWSLLRVLALPQMLEVTNAKGPTSVPATPCMAPDDWLPPFPITQCAAVSGPIFEYVAQLLHLAQDDTLRPEFGCVCFDQTGAYAGDEAQFAGTTEQLTGVTGCVLIPAPVFRKWPGGQVHWWASHDRVYFQIGAELRVADLPRLKGWVAPRDATPSPSAVYMTIPLKQFLAPYKEAKKIADRRLVALGTSKWGAWLRIGESISQISPTSAGPTWQVVLDGTRLLEVLRAWPLPDVTVYFDPMNPRAPVVFRHPGYFEALYPMIPVDSA